MWKSDALSRTQKLMLFAHREREPTFRQKLETVAYTYVDFTITWHSMNSTNNTTNDSDTKIQWIGMFHHKSYKYIPSQLAIWQGEFKFVICCILVFSLKLVTYVLEKSATFLASKHLKVCNSSFAMAELKAN